MRFYLALCTLIFAAIKILPAQVVSKIDSIEVNFIFEINGNPLELGKSVLLNKRIDTVTIDRFRFYIGDIRLDEERDTSMRPQDRYRLVDAEIPSTQRFRVPVTAKKSSLNFRFGVDSLTNDAGVHGGDLDPTKGMYWAWQTGYVNFKIEGSNKGCKNFGYHLGGFLDGADASTEVFLAFDFSKVESGTDGPQLQLVFEIADFLKEAAVIADCHLMRPSEEAVSLAQAFQKHLTLRY